MKIVRIVVLLAIPWAVLPACGGDEPRSRRFIRRGEGGGSPELKKIDMATAGTIAGTVHFGGDEIPQMEAIRFNDALCKEPHHGEPAYREFVIVNPNKTLKNCIVYVDSPDLYEVPTEPAVLDQIGCIYTPHVLAMRAGQPFHVKSSDPLLHNVHWQSFSGNNKNANFAMRRPETREFVLEYPDYDPPIYVKCDVHPWMGAHLALFDHPFFAVTDDTGSFTIGGVPPDQHLVKVWHEKYGLQPPQRVTVTTGQTVTVDVTITP